MNKFFIDANQLLIDSMKLAKMIHSSGFIPDLIAGVWRGGAPVAISVHEYFVLQGLNPDHIAIRALSYTGINQRSSTVKLSGLEYIYENTRNDAELLIIDDVFDTGSSFNSIVSALIEHYGEASRKRIKIACPWYKPANNKTHLVPDYYVNQTDKWLVFPHELDGLSESELREGKNEVFKIIHAN